MTRLRAFDATPFRPAGVADDAVVSVFRVPPEVAGQRLDVFVQSQLHRTSRTRAQTIDPRRGAYDAAGRRLLQAERSGCRRSSTSLLWRPAWDETPVPLDIPVLYEDEHLIAVAKPALLPVHPTARYHRNTLIKLLQAARPESAFLSLGHRLDRETSGVILISKTRACDRALKKQLADREDIEKTYVAITWGIPDRGDGATTFRHERSLALDTESPLRVKMRIHDSPDALYASTIIEVAEVRQRGLRASWAQLQRGAGSRRAAAAPDPGASWRRSAHGVSSATSSPRTRRSAPSPAPPTAMKAHVERGHRPARAAPPPPSTLRGWRWPIRSRAGP